MIIAIDGGGTRCRVAASDGDQAVTIETGSANVSTDFESAVDQIEQGLARLAARLGQPVESLSAMPAYVGVAGVTGPAVAERLRSVLPFRHVRISDDRPAAVRGVLGPRDGFIGHCGTGSFFAGQQDGEIVLSGGWGPVLGDEASAQWVGRKALCLTLETVDGRLERSPLSDLLLSEFEDAAGIVRFASTAQPVEFGALAPHVTAFAVRQDAIAGRIMRQGADEIARALRHLGWRPGDTVSLTGGIGPFYAPYLPDDLRASVADRTAEPLDGAISLAREFAREIANECN